MAFAMLLSMRVLSWLSPDNSLLRTGIKCVVPLAKPRPPTAGFVNRLCGEEVSDEAGTSLERGILSAKAWSRRDAAAEDVNAEDLETCLLASCLSRRVCCQRRYFLSSASTTAPGCTAARDAALAPRSVYLATHLAN